MLERANGAAERRSATTPRLIMQVSPTIRDWQRGDEIYGLFSRKPGSEAIASSFALAHLSAVLRTSEINSVLEFGAGIGTITYLLVHSLPDAKIVCMEKNNFCLGQLKANIPPPMYERLEIHSNYRRGFSESFDLVVVDGKVGVGSVEFVREGTICFAEGGRSQARESIQAGLKPRGLACDFERYSARKRLFEWRKAGWGMVYPWPLLNREQLTKGCWLGRVRPSGRAAASP